MFCDIVGLVGIDVDSWISIPVCGLVFGIVGCLVRSNWLLKVVSRSMHYPVLCLNKGHFV